MKGNSPLVYWLLLQPAVLQAWVAVEVCCWLVFSLLSPRMPGSFSAVLPPASLHAKG